MVRRHGSVSEHGLHTNKPFDDAGPRMGTSEWFASSRSQTDTAETDRKLPQATTETQLPPKPRPFVSVGPSASPRQCERRGMIHDTTRHTSLLTTPDHTRNESEVLRNPHPILEPTQQAGSSGQ
ncbi:hypothetical protein Hypma_010759 [Hypsizygus marmoreus]|uniref:Uncharacterized protein n=1 Tax=Hypsizygus marmoreus TaxID=39966 RepID=A0A369JNL0_HYPMA|nr:hypothetical protein Hypma_010759 [Hypsizygus marmoreus]